MSELEIDVSAHVRDLEILSENGKTVMFFAVDDKLVGIMAASDGIADGASEALRLLSELGTDTVMLTGDNSLSAKATAERLGISSVISDVLPHEKGKAVSDLKKDGRTVVMVGDGINDAPALSTADVGIAIGAGSDIAIDSADIVLIKNDISDVARALKYSRSVLVNIKENLFWAFFYNAVCIPIAAGVLYPAFGITLSPMLASAAMSVSSLCVVTNALRLRSISIRKGDKKMFGKKENVTYILQVEGMMCQHCVAHVKSALEGIKGVKEVLVDLDAGTATVTAVSSVSEKILAEAIVKAGYSVK
jgi:cation transport ATPase